MSGTGDATEAAKGHSDGSVVRTEENPETPLVDVSIPESGGNEDGAQDKTEPVKDEEIASSLDDVGSSHDASASQDDANKHSGTIKRARSPLADDIEREASEHMARRAAEMMGSEDIAQSTFSTKDDLPTSPPAPAVPEKDNDASKSQGATMYDEKRPPRSAEPSGDVPEAPPGTRETTGEEIQSIMDQFQQRAGGMGEEEIMSPRLERQQSVLILPPRTSSLENKDRRTISPQSTGGSMASQPFSPERSQRAPSLSGQSLQKMKSDDTESIKSAKASSMFQPPPPSPDPEPALPFDFGRFLDQLRHRTADPVARFLRSFLHEFARKRWMVHEQVKIISDFLEFITKKMAQCEVWKTVSDAEFDNAREGMEKLVMNRLHGQTFSPAIPAVTSPRKAPKGSKAANDSGDSQAGGRRGQHQEDVERDDVIAQKLRIYGWIREEHLDIKPINEKARKFLLLAQQELLKINAYRAPRDKVICVLNCCKVIFGFLRNTKGDQSADSFVPLLIYTVLHARPEHLVSNVQYIWRFRNQDKLGGEAGYYMSSLMGVVAFIENLDRTNLTITDEEFEKEVEQAVSAIAEKNKAEEYEEKAHTAAAAAAASPMQRLTEKSALSRPEVTPRNSMDAEQSSPRRNLSQRLSEKAQSSSSTSDADDSDAVTGLLRTIQKPLSSIGRIFSDDSQQSGGLRPASTPLPGSTPRGPSPSSRTTERQAVPRLNLSQAIPQPSSMQAAEAAARQASAEAAQVQKLRANERQVVFETLESMFPNLDREVIDDVVTAQEGNVPRAVDACLALSGGGGGAGGGG